MQNSNRTTSSAAMALRQDSVNDSLNLRVRSAEELDKEVYNYTGETGTYRYMAPEVYRHEPYNGKADVYRCWSQLYSSNGAVLCTDRRRRCTVMNSTMAKPTSTGASHKLSSSELHFLNGSAIGTEEALTVTSRPGCIATSLAVARRTSTAALVALHHSARQAAAPLPSVGASATILLVDVSICRLFDPQLRIRRSRAISTAT